MIDDKKMKIMCKWCNVSKICHIVSQEITDHHGIYGIDSVMMAKVKIHKHFKGKKYFNQYSIKRISITNAERNYQKRRKDLFNSL